MKIVGSLDQSLGKPEEYQTLSFFFFVSNNYISNNYISKFFHEERLDRTDKKD